MKVTKAVITAAGRGTRFLPAVKAYPKELVPILNKPQIQYLVEEVLGAGIRDICIVHRHGNPSIKRYFTPDSELELYLKSQNKLDYLSSLQTIWDQVRFKFIPQPRHLPYGSCSPLFAAKNFIGQDAFVYLFGDDLTVETTPGHFLSQLISTFDHTHASAAFAVQEVPHAEIVKYGCVEYRRDPPVKNQIVRIIEKPSLKEAPSDMANGGRAVVSPEALRFIDPKNLGKNNEFQFIDVINQLARIGIVVTEKYQQHDSLWYTTGDPLNWLKVNIALARQHGFDIF